MIKIEQVTKMENAYSIIFSEGLACYGALIELFENKPVEIEFMEMQPTDPEPVLVTEESNKKRFDELKEKYLNVILEQANK